MVMIIGCGLCSWFFCRVAGATDFCGKTEGPGDIINNSIQSADIKDAEVKTVALGQASVTNGKIKDGEVRTEEIRDATIHYADFSRSAIVVEHRD